MKHLINIRNSVVLAVFILQQSNLFAQWSGSNPISTGSNVNIKSPGNDASLDVGGTGDSATVQITAPGLISGSYAGPLRIRGTNTVFHGPPTWGFTDYYFPLFCVDPNGFVGLRTETPAEMLTLNGGNALILNGNLIARNGNFITQNSSGTTNFKVDANGLLIARQIDVHLDPIPDYVFHAAFNKDSAELYNMTGKYKMLSLFETENFVRKYYHLPGIKSAGRYRSEGRIDLGELNLKLLEKVEELTLHAISQQKELDNLKERLGEIESKSIINKQVPFNSNAASGLLIATFAIFAIVIGRGQFSKLLKK